MSHSRPAPGSLEKIRAFVNSFEKEKGIDHVATPAALGRWLADHDLPTDGAPTDSQFREAVELREALRRMLAGNNDEPVQPRDIRILNRIAAQGDVSLTIDATDGAALRATARGVDGALGQLVAIVATAMLEGTWDRFKACRNDVCRWAFYDYTRNRSRKWCDMSICGSRIKSQAYRRRRRATR
jgi:predicted RNA-binding Zn ribbon-like protein